MVKVMSGTIMVWSDVDVWCGGAAVGSTGRSPEQEGGQLLGISEASWLSLLRYEYSTARKLEITVQTFREYSTAHVRVLVPPP